MCVGPGGLGRQPPMRLLRRRALRRAQGHPPEASFLHREMFSPCPPHQMAPTAARAEKHGSQAGTDASALSLSHASLHTRPRPRPAPTGLLLHRLHLPEPAGHPARRTADGAPVQVQRGQHGGRERREGGKFPRVGCGFSCPRHPSLPRPLCPLRKGSHRSPVPQRGLTHSGRMDGRARTPQVPPHPKRPPHPPLRWPLRSFWAGDGLGSSTDHQK